MYVRYLIIFVVFFQEIPNILSTHTTKCSLQDSECLTLQAQNMLQEFVKGNPALGIPILDPVQMDPIKETIGDFWYEWTDIKMSGLGNAEIKNISFYVDYKVIRLLFQTSILMEFHHAAKGVAISNVYIEGEGEATITYQNMEIELLFGYDIVKGENGKDFLNVKTTYCGLSRIENVHYSFGNVFNGDMTKGANLHEFLNTAWRALVANFGKNIHIKMTEKPSEAIKTYLSSHPLEDLALY